MHRRATPWATAMAVMILGAITVAPTQDNAHASEQWKAVCDVTDITDGDTIDARCDGASEEIRLNCIDAPETSQHPWGQRATRQLQRLLGDRVRVVAHERGHYGRVIATLYSPTEGDRRDINRAMVAAGAAAVYDRYCDRPSYIRAERDARRAESGIWSQPGLHRRPWVYRHRND